MSGTSQPPSGRIGGLVLGVILIGLGLLFLALNLLSVVLRRDLLGLLWPAIFYAGALVFYIPALINPQNRRELSGLFIPGTILLALGLIFTYNVLSGDWGSWAYAWTLIPAGVGLGLALGSVFGGWGSGATTTGLVMAAISAGAFALFASVFGGLLFKLFGPALIILIGLLLLVRAVIRR